MSTMRLQTFTPLEELKHLCLGGEPYPPSISEEPTDALVAKLGFASTVQFQYMRFEQQVPHWLESLITYLVHELEERFKTLAVDNPRSEPNDK